MDSILIYQAANDLVQNTGTRNIKRIARSCSLDISETPRFKDVLGFLSLHFDKPLILINSHLDSQTKHKLTDTSILLLDNPLIVSSGFTMIFFNHLVSFSRLVIIDLMLCRFQLHLQRSDQILLFHELSVPYPKIVRKLQVPASVIL